MLSLAAENNTTPLWATFAIAAIPAVAAILAAVFAARSANKARVSQGEIERLRLIEQRVAATKLETYRPMLKLTGDMLDKEKAKKMSQADLRSKLSDYSTWISMVGSDESVSAFHNFMQVAYAGAPAPLFLRVYADFLLSARRDLGDPSTGVTRLELLGQRITDLYANDSKAHIALSGDFDAAC